MNTATGLRHAAAATAIAALVVGVVWHDTLPIALACIVAFRLALVHLQDKADIDAWRVSLRCIALGLLGLFAATLLIALTAGALMSWWVVDHPHPHMVLVGTIMAGALLTGSRAGVSGSTGARRELRTWGPLGAVAALALQLADAGYAEMLCLLVAGAGVHLGWHSWVIAHHVAADLLRGSARSL